MGPPHSLHAPVNRLVGFIAPAENNPNPNARHPPSFCFFLTSALGLPDSRGRRAISTPPASEQSLYIRRCKGDSTPTVGIWDDTLRTPTLPHGRIDPQCPLVPHPHLASQVASPLRTPHSAFRIPSFSCSPSMQVSVLASDTRMHGWLPPTFR